MANPPQPVAPQTHSLTSLVGREVVFDTSGPVTFMGTLREICPDGYWLTDADIRDRTEGHVSKEVYIREARLHGVQPNRGTIFVFADKVVSCSALEDVVID
ncbi:MAG TPA: hypothetical protein VNQ14_11525 [Woeseiaceae bacterium]|nr:hypothetical protein [Woeseiaceae bacterium]